MLTGPVTLGQLADAIGVTLLDDGDAGVEVSSVADLATAGPGQLSLYIDPARRDEALVSAASALLVRRADADVTCPQLICDDVSRALGRALELLVSAGPERPVGVDPRAAVDPRARIDPSAWVAPFCFIGANVEVGAGAQLLPSSYVGAGATIGPDCLVGPGAMVGEGCELAPGVVLAAGAVVGGEGFGLYQDEAGMPRRIPSRGSVRLGEGVELGANSCVDRGTLSITELEAGAKVDNLVQVGHNTRVGRGAVLCAQVGLAGSVDVGDGALLGGQVGVADHRRIGAGARVGAQSGVAQDVPAGERVSGYPAMPQRRWLRASALFRRLAELAAELKRLRGDVSRLRGERED